MVGIASPRDPDAQLCLPFIANDVLVVLCHLLGIRSKVARRRRDGGKGRLHPIRQTHRGEKEIEGVTLGRIVISEDFYPGKAIENEIIQRGWTLEKNPSGRLSEKRKVSQALDCVPETLFVVNEDRPSFERLTLPHLCPGASFRKKLADLPAVLLDEAPLVEGQPRSVIPLGEVKEAEDEPCVRILRDNREHFFAERFPLLVVSLAAPENSEFEERWGVLRINGKSRLELLPCLFDTSRPPQDRREPMASLGRPWPETDRFAEGLLCSLKIVLLVEDRPQLVVGLGFLPVEKEDCPESQGRFLDPLILKESLSVGQPGLGIHKAEAQRTVECSYRLGTHPLLQKSFSQVELDPWICPVPLFGFPELFDGS